MDGVLVPAVKLATFRTVIREAVDELRDSAETMRSSYMVGDTWPPCSVDEEAIHNRVMECAASLVWYERSSTVAADPRAGAVWVSVEDRLPDDGVIVLVFQPLAASEPVWLGYYDSDLESWCGADHDAMQPSHWMELPAPPDVPELVGVGS